ncbi:MAG: M23 family metallopeptidase [Acidimicrobiia bacterium]
MGNRKTVRVSSFAAVLAAVVAFSPVASAEEPPSGTTTTTAPETTTTTAPATAAPAPAKPNIKFKPVKRYDVKRNLVFPVVGVTKFWSGFGDCRDNCNREHHGIDIVTYDYKGLPVVAAHDGTITKVTHDEGNAGCSVRIRGRDGWETRYYHLNTDSFGTDDGEAACPIPGIRVGVAVKAGQVIGYLGDSGNSEDTVPHLHFELRSRSGYPIDPYKSLRAAKKISFEWLPEDAQAASLALSAASRYQDVSSLILVCADEWNELTISEVSATVIDAPVVVIDKNNPIPALTEITRLAPDRIVIVSDEPTHGVEELVRPLTTIVDSAPLTHGDIRPYLFDPDEVSPSEWDQPDRFTTIVAGAVHKIWRSRQATYNEFITEHRSVVIAHDYYAPVAIGQRLWSSPGKWADSSKVWWYTGDGWVGTEPDEPAPHPGIAYVTERRAQPYTLAFLESVAELPPYPVWKSS